MKQFVSKRTAKWLLICGVIGWVVVTPLSFLQLSGVYGCVGSDIAQACSDQTLQHYQLVSWGIVALAIFAGASILAGIGILIALRRNKKS